MSIISSDAKWAVIRRGVRLSPEEARGTTKGKEYEAGFIAGATRRPTDEEIKAACLAIMPYVIAQPSQQVFDFLTKATGAYPGQEIVRKVIDAMQGKATEGGRR